MAQVCTLMGIRHSPRTPFSPGTNGLIEVQILGLILTLLYVRHTKSICTINNYQPLSAPNVSHEIVFHTRARLPLTFYFILNRNIKKLAFPITVLNFQNTHIMTNLILLYVSIEHFLNSFLNGFSQWKPPCYKSIL